jgi:hypothetical protein
MATITTSGGTEIHYKNWGKDPAVTMAAGSSTSDGSISTISRDEWGGRSWSH